jgi:hypothetical protein
MELLKAAEEAPPTDNYENQVYSEEAFVRGACRGRKVRSPRDSPLCGDGSVSELPLTIPHVRNPDFNREGRSVQHLRPI